MGQYNKSIRLYELPTGTPIDFPMERPPDYFPGWDWDFADGAWGDYPEIDVVGGGRYKNDLVIVSVDVIGKGKIWTTQGEISTLNGFTAGDLSILGYIGVVPAYQTVWFCDGRPYSIDINDSGYHKLDMTSTNLVGAASGLFTAGETITQAGTSAAGIFIETVGSGVTAKNLIYRTTTTEFDTSEVSTVRSPDPEITLTPTQVLAPPHWLNWIPTVGDFPDGGSNIMCLFEGRLWMNSMYNPNQWFASRQGDPLDLDTSQDDVQAAFSSQTSEAGVVADAIVALIPFKDNYLLFGMANSFGILRGGSTGGGNISNLTTETGIFSPESWCWDNNGNLYIVSLTGFFKFPNQMAVSGVAIDNISLRKLPKLFETLKLNRKTDRVVLGFDKDKNQIHISISTQDGAWSVALTYDIATDSLFPDKFTTEKVPSAFLYINSYQDDLAGLLVGCYDGYVRKFDSDEKSDDGVAIHSYCLFGPVTINEIIRGKVKVQEIQITLSGDSDGLTWKLYQATSNEVLVDGIRDGSLSPTHTGTFSSGGKQLSIRDKIANESIAVFIESNTVGQSWGMESIKFRWDISGKVKE